MKIALINTNRIKPPIAPIGLEYVGEALLANGYRAEVLDLCWESEWENALRAFFRAASYDVVGLTLRNTDDCSFTSRHSFLPSFIGMVKAVRSFSSGIIVLGGCGFSIMPAQILRSSDADAGIYADGEFAFPKLVRLIEAKDDWKGLSNLIFMQDSEARRNPVFFEPLSNLPPMERNLIDNRRYFREGGQAGFETKRGCPTACVYCADPVAKGDVSRTRPPGAIVHELKSLASQGIDHLHTCDSEYNIPLDHAMAVCEEMKLNRTGDKLRWYAYCSPAPFSRELAELMRSAGCVGINFGTDSGDERMLKRLGRSFKREDICKAVAACKEAGIRVMLDLLLGSPGETKKSLAATIEFVKKLEPDVVGVSAGVRIYCGTKLARSLERKTAKKPLSALEPRPISPRPILSEQSQAVPQSVTQIVPQFVKQSLREEDLSNPQFYMEPELALEIFQELDRLIGDDERFFFFDPARPARNYNYNANERLSDAILKGHRGAYWDILRRCASER